MEQTRYTAFEGEKCIAAGPPATVALAVKRALEEDGARRILVFDDRTGRAVDFDLRGGEAEVAARLGAEPEGQVAPRAPGRPRLGVTAREVTLLPRHWEWLAEQPGGASVTLRKLVEAARASGGEKERRRAAQAAADRFMSAMLGDRPGYEEAARALYAGRRDDFAGHVQAWPEDLVRHLWRLAGPAFGEQDAPD
jgi:hypothetical protein